MICIDVGSGYNPKQGYLTCDTNYGCDFASIKDIPINSVDRFHIRNVIHHIDNLQEFVYNLSERCKIGCVVDVIDCSKYYYYQNLCLDNLWYRYVNKRMDIYISPIYRDFIDIFESSGFILLSKQNKEEKLLVKFKYTKQ